MGGGLHTNPQKKVTYVPFVLSGGVRLGQDEAPLVHPPGDVSAHDSLKGCSPYKKGSRSTRGRLLINISFERVKGMLTQKIT